MKIGSVIATLRIERGLTQDDLADKSETTKTSISRIESDEQWPRAALLESLASALDVQIYQIFARAEKVALPVDPVQLTQEESQLLDAYKAMEPDQQSAYLDMARAIVKPVRRKGPRM